MGRSKIVGTLPRMPLQVLRYAISISEHGSTLAAAHEVNLTSSALSRQIAQLEHELGIALFERHSRGMRPTAAGEVFIDAARQMVARMERLAADLDDVQALKRGHVTLYASEALVEDFLLPNVIENARLFPNIKVDLVIGSGRQAEKALLNGKADFAVIFNAPGHSDLSVVAERRNRLVAIVGRSHPLASITHIDASKLLEGSLALPPRSYATRVAFDALLPPDQRGFQSHLTINSIAALKAYARSGAGAAVVPELALWGQDSLRDLALIELIGSEKTGTRICLCSHKTRPLSSAATHILNDLLATFPAYAAGDY